MSYTPPKVYISAAAAGLRSVLEGVREGLMSVGLVPVGVRIGILWRAEWDPVNGEAPTTLNDRIR